MSSVRPQTSKILAAVDGPVVLTYFVTHRDRLPSAQKRVEGEVMRVLHRLQAHAPDKVVVEVIDPGLDPGLASLAADRRVSPRHVTQIVSDRSSEATVWSSLLISAADEDDVLLSSHPRVFSVPCLFLLEDLVLLLDSAGVAIPGEQDTAGALLSRALIARDTRMWAHVDSVDRACSQQVKFERGRKGARKRKSDS